SLAESQLHFVDEADARARRWSHDERQRGPRRVVHGQQTGRRLRAEPSRAWRQQRDAKDFFDLLGGQAAWSQQTRRWGCHVDDGRFHAHVCWTAFDYGVNTAVQVIEDVPCASRTGPSESIRARRGDWQARCSKKLARDRVGRHTHGDGVQTRGYLRRHEWLLEQHERERPRPEAAAEQLRCRVRDSYASELGGIA